MNRARAYLVLKELAHIGATERFVVISTSRLGDLLGSSQQSTSRWLNELASEGLIQKERAGKNTKVKITERGMLLLKREFFDLLHVFEGYELRVIRGEVTSGLGEGRYYVMKEGYRKQINEKMFFDPYPGTLNVRVYPQHKEDVIALRDRESITLNGFVENGRHYGRVHGYLASINGVRGALIIPEMSHYREIVEVISPLHLREYLQLDDGDEVEIKVLL